MKKWTEPIKRLGSRMRVLAKEVAKHYFETSSRSLRLELLHLVGGVALVALVVGSSVTGILHQTAVGQRTYRDYTHNKESAEAIIEAVGGELEALQYRQVAIEPIAQTLYNEIELITSDALLEQDKLYRFQECITYNTTIYVGRSSYRYNEIIDGGLLEGIDVLYQELEALVVRDRWDNDVVEQKLETYLRNHVAIKGFIQQETQNVLGKYEQLQGYMNDYTLYIMDDDGHVIYPETYAVTLDRARLIDKVHNGRESNRINVLAPLVIEGVVHHVFIEGSVREEWVRYHNNLPNVIGSIVGIGLFIYLIFKLTSKKIRYMEYLSECLDKIAGGNLDYRIEIQGHDELAGVASNMQRMQEQLKMQMAKRDQAEHSKNELITNVAHDLRTPLTSIIGYIGLVKDKGYQETEEAARYLAIAYSKSERLKMLIEDLFEYTKLTSRDTALKKETISLTVLLQQLIEECYPQCEAKGIRMVLDVKSEDNSVCVDVLKMARVFDNLLSNAIKYNSTKSPVMIVVQSQKGAVYATVRNRCEAMSEGEVKQLYERFYRTDASRNSRTGGSGLGLAIAKYIVESHQGKLWTQLDGDIISFTVKLEQV